MNLKWLWWTIGLVAFLVMLYSCALPGDLVVGRDDETGLAGTYTVNGVDPTGAEYSGTLVLIAADDADRYDLEWIITGTIRSGSGERRGDALEVTWEATSSASGPARGTGRYVIAGDGSMTGTWTVDGTDGTGSEEIFPDP